MRQLFILAMVILLANCSNTINLHPSTSAINPCTSIEMCAESIHDAITNRWKRPKSARNHMIVAVEVLLDEEFAVTSLRITQNDGDEEYGQSAVDAVQLSSPFWALSGLTTEAFNQHFSKFILIFDPQDL